MGKDFACCAVVMLLLTTVFFALQKQVCLHVQDGAGEQVFYYPLGPGGDFGIRFVHSVAKSPVEDWFGLGEGGQVALKRTVYKDFGAGLPHEALAEQKMFFRDGNIEIKGYNLLLPRLEVRVGRVAQHALLLFNRHGWVVRNVALNTLISPGQALTFTLRRHSRAEAMMLHYKVSHNSP